MGIVPKLNMVWMNNEFNDLHHLKSILYSVPYGTRGHFDRGIYHFIFTYTQLNTWRLVVYKGVETVYEEGGLDASTFMKTLTDYYEKAEE